ncbi:MAG: DUF7146 domain-containing protein [Steroidobacteraceae bacterium]
MSYCHRCGYAAAEHRERARYEPARTIARSEPLDWSTRAESVWRRTQSLRGTIGETYLCSRGCTLPPRDSHLRFLPSTDKHPPSLCACVTDARGVSRVGWHRGANDICGPRRRRTAGCTAVRTTLERRRPSSTHPDAAHSWTRRGGRGGRMSAARDRLESGLVPVEIEAPAREIVELPAGASDDELALRFTQRHAHEFRYVPAWDRWLVWDGCRWAHDEKKRV